MDRVGLEDRGEGAGTSRATPSVPPPKPKGSRRRRRIARRIVLAIAALVVSACLAEGLVRIAFGVQPKFPRYVAAAPFGVRINLPNARYRHRSADVDVAFRINGQGMRSDREFAHAKPPGVRRVVSLGDSFTVGYEVEVEDCFSSVLERELVGGGDPVEVLNAGVSGHSTAEECLYLERELLRYEPDLVVVSFCGNDVADNLRTGLFRLDGETLVEAASAYLPFGGLADFLNRNPFTRLLSERSDAFVWFKERTTVLLRRRLVEENLRGLATPAGRNAPTEVAPDYGSRLTAAILDRIYAATQRRAIPLLVQTIPVLLRRGNAFEMVDVFPYGAFDTKRPGLALVAAMPLLRPYEGSEPLYHLRSHYHWTPFSHRLAGRELARTVREKGWLRP